MIKVDTERCRLFFDFEEREDAVRAAHAMGYVIVNDRGHVVAKPEAPKFFDTEINLSEPRQESPGVWSYRLRMERE